MFQCASMEKGGVFMKSSALTRILPFGFFMLILLMVESCRSVAPVVETPRNDSIVLRYEYMHDSIYIDRAHYEFLKGDTVYLHDTVTQKYFSIVNKVDTIYLDKEVVITHPPEKYVPPFYKWCAGILISGIIAIILYVVLRIVIKVYLKR